MAKRIVDEEMRFTIIVNGNDAQKELYDLEKSTRELTASNKDLRAERAKLQAAGKRGSEEYKKLSAEIKANSVKIGENNTKMKGLRDQIGITGLTMNQLKKQAMLLRFQLINMIPGSAEYKRLESDLQRVNARMAELRRGSAATESTMSKVAGSFNKYAALGASIIATLTGVALSMQKIIDYNGKLADAQSDVQKTTGLTAKEVDNLSASFGILQTRTSRIDLLKIAEEGGRIGIAKDEIADFVAIMDKAVVALSDSFPGGAEETASKLGKLKLLFKETKDLKVGEAYNAIGSAINDLGADGVATENNIAEFATRLGSMSDALKPSIADALALGAAFEESGIQAEIAARAYSIVLNQASTEASKFADVMGLTTEQVEALINENPLEFMIKFADGLRGMNATETAQTLDYLGVSADGANKVLGAMANNQQLFRSRLELSNQSMKDGTSLINEYNVKNNNLAATMEKVSKAFQGMLGGKAVSNLLTGLVTIFGRLIGAIKDVNEEIDKEIQVTYESAKANRKLANESQNLLDRYEELTADGVEPTAEAKEELDIITLRLKDRLGESVMAIDKETGAYILNTDAVREQIKMKRLAADEEASTLASRLVGVKEEQKVLAIRQRDALKEFESRKKFFESKYADDIAEIKNSEVLSQVEKQKLLERLDGYKELYQARSAYNQVNKEIEIQLNREADLVAKLNELNFTPQDATNLISPEETGPKEGDTKEMGGQTFIFKNGKWELVRVFTPPGKDPKQKAEKDESIEILRQNLLLKAQLIDDAFLAELAVYDTQHDIKMQKLSEQLVTEGKLTEDQIRKNGAIRAQLRLEQELYEKDRGTFIMKGLSEQFKAEEENYQRSKTLRQTKYAEELAAYAGNKEAQKELRELHQKEELEAEAKHLEELIRQFNYIMDEGSFGGFDLEILTPEQKAEMEKMLDDIKLKLAEVAAEKAKLSGSGETDGLDLGTGGKIDIFGFSAQDWVDTFTNLDTVESKINAAGQAVQGFLNAWSTYYQYVNDNENRHLRQFERNQNKERTKLKNNLDSKLINQRQYDQGIAALEADMDKRKADLEYKQAKRAWKMQLANAIATAAMATLNGFNSTPFLPVGLIMGALAATLGTIQVGIIAKNKPVRGYESGYYPDTFPVEREQDGKIFNARYGGKPKSGLVKDPTILVGEMPELIISNPDLKRMNPEVISSVGREIRRVRGYESGYTSPDVERAGSAQVPQADYIALMAVISENSDLLRELKENGLNAWLVRDMENAKKLQDDLDKLKKYKQKSQI
jgi:TP901 family phage tail tape measure protein